MPKKQNNLVSFLEERNKENCFGCSNVISVENHNFPKKIHNFIRSSLGSKEVE